MTRPTQLAHLDAAGNAHMVDVGGKAITARTATAEALVRMRPDTLAAALQDNAKGDVLAVVRIAAIQGAKHCAQLIPLCHPLGLDRVEVELLPDLDAGTLAVRVNCALSARTGVEMEAMTGASVGALACYDMVKSFDKGIVIEAVRLLAKTGGKSGDWYRDDAATSGTTAP